MTGNLKNDRRQLRREEAERRSRELRDRFMDLATKWVLLRQRFLVALGIQPPKDDADS